MSIYSEIIAFFDQHERSLPGESFIAGQGALVLGVSGGPDSITLLHVLAERGLFDKSRIIVAHLNHQLRPTAERDANYVRRISEEWGLTFHRQDIDVAGLARRERLGIEHAGRKARYRFLASVANKANASAILTAHNANDQVETVLMHIMRGTGLAGLRGILPVASNPESPGIQVLRPFLNIWRDEIIAYCEKFDLDPVIDPTNYDESYFRNRIRNSLIPLLLDYNPAIQQNLHNLAALTTGEYEDTQVGLQGSWSDYIASEEPNEIRFDLPRWRAASLGKRRNLLRMAWQKLSASEEELGFRALELVRTVAETGITGDSVVLPAGVGVSLDYDQLVFTISADEKPLDKYPQIQKNKTIPVSKPSLIDLNQGWYIETELLTEFNYKEITGNADPWTAFICVDELEKLQIRPRVSGESFRPIGMSGSSKKVSRLMIDEKVPASYRDFWPLLASNSHLLWVVGYHLDERVMVTPQCRRVLRVQVRRDKPF